MQTDDNHGAAKQVAAVSAGEETGGVGANHRVRLTPRELEFETDGARTVLLAAEANGVVLPSSCRNGTCRTCLCRLSSGTVSYIVDWPGLSADEKREGWILPCVALARSDLIIEAPAARRSPAP